MVYESEDRASTKRILLTLAAAVAIGAVVLAGLVFAVDAMFPPATTVSSASSEPAVPSVETTPASAEPAEEEPEPAPAEPVIPAPAPTPEPAPAPAPTTTGIVCIDPGHQGTADSSQEPIGPGASETKPKVAGGTKGVATGVPESQTNLEIALLLRDELKTRGITVVMVRESESVNISNSERAAVANNAEADLFIRLHCDGVASSATNGISMLVPGVNQWTGPIAAESQVAGAIVLPAMIAATGAKSNGVVKRTDLSGFNWCTVPCILPEMGFMTNPDEDRRLNSDEYQKKLAVGMANGIVEYLKTK